MESDYTKPLNIGSDRVVSINELADMIIRISGKRITKTHNLSAPQGVRGRNADLNMVERVLRWQPQVALENGLAKTYRWIHEQLSLSWKKESGIVFSYFDNYWCVWQTLFNWTLRPAPADSHRLLEPNFIWTKTIQTPQTAKTVLADAESETGNLNVDQLEE